MPRAHGAGSQHPPLPQRMPAAQLVAVHGIAHPHPHRIIPVPKSSQRGTVPQSGRLVQKGAELVHWPLP